MLSIKRHRESRESLKERKGGNAGRFRMFDAPNAQEVNSPASVANARGEGRGVKRNRGVWFAGDEGKELTRR